MTDPTQATTLLVSCPDQRGIVAALAQVLYGHGANILDSDQHTDATAGVFFQRIRFECSDLRTDRSSLENAISEVAARMGMSWKLCEEGIPNAWRYSFRVPTTASSTCCCGTARENCAVRFR